MTLRHLIAGIAGAGLLALAGCDAPPPPASSTPPAGISKAEGEAACLDALIAYHSVEDVRIVSSEPSQGGGRFVRGSVRVSTDGKRELWQCIASADGSTGELAYLAADPDGAGPDTAGTPSDAEQACLAAVSRETNNGDVSVLSSEFSQAGTFVTVGVGPQRAPWKCIAYSDGTTDGVEFMGNEGTL